MSFDQALVGTLILGHTVLLIVLARYIPRFGRQMPWLVALFIYFAIREARAVRRFARLLEGSTDRVPDRFDLVADFLGLLAIVFLIVTSDRMLAGFQAMSDAAAFRKQEYERAFRHYTQLVRHRVLNPLTVIRGAAITVKAGVPDQETRDKLLDVIVEAADTIEKTALEPERLGREEQELDAVARVDHHGD